MIPLTVSAGAQRYPVFISRGSLASLGKRFSDAFKGGRAFVVSDETVWKLYGQAVSDSLNGAGVKFSSYVVPAGEASKSLPTLMQLYSAMAQNGFTRSDAVVALGGGVVGDLAGVAAATFLRGLGFVQVPTTLLSQVDSSIGGKVAVDIPEGKNLVGAFYQPKFVLIDPDVLETLPDDQFSFGMAEVIKHAAIANAGLFDTLEKHAGRQALRRQLPAVIRTNLVIKRGFVRRDVQDNGPRMALNFGHTIGHALEQQAGFTGISHGEAVAQGMCRITRVSEALGLSAPGTAERLERLCRAFNLPADVPEATRAGLLEIIQRDKKARGDTITLVLLKEIGKCFFHTIQLNEVGRFL